MFTKILTDATKVLVRPVANFHPCPWGDHFLKLEPLDEATKHKKEQEVNELKDEVKKELLETKANSIEKLELINALERLGVAYHFEHEIEDALKHDFESNYITHLDEDDLYHVSTHFRILRQHGYCVPSEIFNQFKDDNGKFKESLTSDTRGLLSLYEACHVRIHEDQILDEALCFCTTHLNAMVSKLSSPLKEEVSHALHQPLHKGMPRVESRNYISVYEKYPLHNKTLLKLAKLDFNLLQALHQEEVKDLTSWWKKLHMKASFSRDRSIEAYFWILGVFYEPQYSFARRILRKIFKATSLLDDTYDAYGTLEELELLTQAFQRSWNKKCADNLPDHVKSSYYAMVEACEEVEEDLAKQGRAFCVNFTREQVKILCQAYLQETKWCHQKYVPTYEEYMKVALITSPYPHGVVACFLGMGDIATKDVFEWACQNPMPNIVNAASTIIRLLDDMGGHKFEQKRNHVASAVECLMKLGLSEKEAIEKLRNQVEDAWKVINQAMLQPFAIPRPLLIRILNLARSAEVIYKGMTDGYTDVNQTLKDKVASVIAHPIAM